jgi:hypothetical protein
MWGVWRSPEANHIDCTEVLGRRRVGRFALVRRRSLSELRRSGSSIDGSGCNGRSRGDVTLKRMDNVLIVVDDLAATKAFFIELGLTLEGDDSRRPLGREPDRARGRSGRSRNYADSDWRP